MLANSATGWAWRWKGDFSAQKQPFRPWKAEFFKPKITFAAYPSCLGIPGLNSIMAFYVTVESDECKTKPPVTVLFYSFFEGKKLKKISNVCQTFYSALSLWEMCGRPAYGYSDADKYGGVVGICWDGLGPVRLAKLVRSRVGSNLRKNQPNVNFYLLTTRTNAKHSQKWDIPVGTKYIY